MFITKKHLSRRTFLRGTGVAIGLPLLDAMVPAWTALAQTAASPKPRLGFMYLPHGAIMDQWTPAAEGTGFRADADPEAARAVPEAVDHRQRAGEQGRDRAAGACAQSGHLAELRDAAAGAGSARRRDRGPDRRRAPRPGYAAAFAGSRDRGTRRQAVRATATYGCSYGGTISFRTPTTPLPMEAIRASCSSGCSARATRRRSARRSRSSTRSILDLVTRGSRRSAANAWTRRIARRSATISRACARSSGACRRWRSTTSRTCDLPEVPVGTRRSTSSSI